MLSLHSCNSSDGCHCHAGDLEVDFTWWRDCSPGVWSVLLQYLWGEIFRVVVSTHGLSQPLTVLVGNNPVQPSISRPVVLLDMCRWICH